MKKIFATLALCVTLTAALLPIYAASRSTVTQFGPNALSSDLQVVPDSTTALSSTDTWIFQLTVANTTGGAVTFTVQDRATSAKTLLAAVSIAANTTYVIAFPEGQKMKNGITWSAGTASALHASIVARRI